MKKLIFFAFALYASVPYAQTGLRNTGSMQIHTGANIATNGDLSNSNSAVLLNNGTFYVKGNINNDQAGMAAGSGTVHLNGTVAQSVNGTAAFRVNNLVTNNAAGITLSNNLSVSAVHTFTSGLITTSATPNYMIYESGSTYSGSSDTRHINGWVKKNGNTGFTFPVGNGTYERPVAISSLSASSEYNCHYYNGTPNNYNLWSPVVQVRFNEYWVIDKISGGTAQVILNWDHSKVAMDNILVPDILTSTYTGGNWTSAGGVASGNATATGSITSSALSIIGRTTFGYKSFPVPLKLISFSGDRRSGTSYLRWVTENEVMVDHFIVERSYDAINYVAIGNVAARNLSSIQNYYLEDRSQFQGIAYYRLKSLDIDGKFTYSNIVALSDNIKTAEAFTVLNPARSGITIFNRSSKEGLFNYRVLNMGGQLVVSGKVYMSANGGAVIPLSAAISTGIHIIELVNSDIQFAQKILVEK
jgi:hypothetical protein